MSSANERAVELAPEEWLPYERLIQRFEQAWERGLRPALDDYLPAGEAQPWAVWVELLHTDLEYRLKAGEAVRVEEYLGRYPELARDREAARELIAAEYSLRRRREPDLARAEYHARFPQYGPDLLPEPTPRSVSAADAGSAGAGDSASDATPRPLGRDAATVPLPERL